MFAGQYAGKKVFVTGHTGFKGSWLSQWLLELGAEVTGYSLYIPSQPSHFEELGLAERMTHLEGDIRNFDQLKSAMHQAKPDFVFHLAAQPIVSRSVAEPLESFETNVMGTAHVLQALRDCPSVKSAVIITSDKAYENVEWEYGYRECDRLGGKDPYSASKGCAEIVFASYARMYFPEDGLQMATGRAGNVIGGGDWAKDRIVPDCVRAWSKNDQPEIRSPRATRPWQHVLEPLSGYLWLGAQLARRHEAIHGESFNFGPPADVNQTVAELIDEMKVTWPGIDYYTKESQLAKKEAGLLKLNCDKALFRLDWQPTLRFEETIALTAGWYKEFYEKTRTASQLTTDHIKTYCDLARERKMEWLRES